MRSPINISSTTDKSISESSPRSESRAKYYRISGHESFSCRYAWLPKLVRLIQKDPSILVDDKRAMIELGIGKNMVRSAKFWGYASGIIENSRRLPSITVFGDQVLGNGRLDPFLEDIRTLWLIHWQLSTNTITPLLAWDYLLNRWYEPEIILSIVAKALHKETNSRDADLSLITIEQHLGVFIRTYVSQIAKKNESKEDNLDCPLVELQLLLQTGERSSEHSLGTRQSIYAFRRDDKPEITPELFAYCLNDFWNKNHVGEKTITFREAAHGYGSPGQIFKLPEENMRERIERLENTTRGQFNYIESSNLQQIRRNEIRKETEMLRSIYKSPEQIDVGE
jgi:hypothetical protein